jgi:hypothetical protein
MQRKKSDVRETRKVGHMEYWHVVNTKVLELE